MSDEQTRSRDILVKAIEKAWTDESFKQVLLSNPLEAMKTLTGENCQFPEGKDIVFVEQDGPAPERTDATVYINIAERSIDDLELSEEQLEGIAGGQKMADIFLPPDIMIWVPTLPE